MCFISNRLRRSVLRSAIVVFEFPKIIKLSAKVTLQRSLSSNPLFRDKDRSSCSEILVRAQHNHESSRTIVEALVSIRKVISGVCAPSRRSRSNTTLLVFAILCLLASPH